MSSQFKPIKRINVSCCETMKSLVKFFIEGNVGTANSIKKTLGMCGKTVHRNLRLLTDSKVLFRVSRSGPNKYSIFPKYQNHSVDKIIKLLGTTSSD